MPLTQGLDAIVGGAGNDTINAFAFNSVSGANTTTLNSVDSIDGGAGTDTLFIEVKSDGASTPANLNGTLQGVVKNVEIINIDQTVATSTPMAVDASKLGTAATTITQIGQAGDVTNLAASTTAGFKNITANVSAAAATGVASVAVALDGFADSIGSTPAVNKASVSGDTLNAVTVTGTVKDGTDTGTTVDKIALAVTVGKDVQTLTVNTAVGTTVTVTTDSTSTKAFTALDASASTGAVAFGGTSANNASTPVTAYKVATITTGSGNDIVTLTADTNAASGSTAAVGATVTTGAGNDQITVDTAASSGLVSTTGTTTVDAGAGNDQVAITTRSSGKLTVNLGDGTDSFTASVAVVATDAIDAGAGTDTLLLSLVGSANVGAFSNFDVFDVKGMTANLDLDILNTKNTVTEIVGSGALAATSSTAAANVTLLNVAAGVNFRATGDMVYDSYTGSTSPTERQGTLTLTQKTAGALTVTLDADETGTADTTIDTAATSVIASNATSLKAVFDTSYLATITSEITSGDNVSTISLAGAVATSLEVVSGGALSSNVLVYTDSASSVVGKLASMTISGDRALDLSYTAAGSSNVLATIDASAMTGGLTAALAAVKDTGSITLGSGVDKITATTGSTGATGAEAIVGLEKALAVSVSTATADATAKAAAIADADKIALGSGTFAVAADGAITGGTIAKGVLSFSGAGPTTLADALTIATGASTTAGDSLVFEYIGNSYFFVEGSTDIVVKLTGVTGVTNLVEDGTTNNFFIV
jgi:trimeric autotransporter adhesin